jgi:hypothetical protein
VSLIRALGIPGPILGTILALCMPTTARAQPAPAPAVAALDLELRRVSRGVAPGLTYTRLTSAGREGRAPVQAHLLLLDPDSVALDLVLAMDQITGQETTRSMVTRTGALAGVNGGFSISNDPWIRVHGDPAGLLVADGEILSAPVEPRPSLAVCPGSGGRSLRVLEPRLRTAVGWAGASAWTDLALNAELDPEGATVYTPEWGRSTLTPAGTVEVVVEGERVVSAGPAGSSAIPAQGFVVAAGGAWLARTTRGRPLPVPGTRARLLRELVDRQSGSPLAVAGCDVTSAGPVLLRDGVPETLAGALPGYRASFVVGRHPRTAVGWGGGRIVLLAVDGRSDEAAGMTLAEVAELLRSVGVAHAYNLDGGGSTTLAVGREVLNRPSDGRERRRCDALVVRLRPMSVGAAPAGAGAVTEPWRRSPGHGHPVPVGFGHG